MKCPACMNKMTEKTVSDVRLDVCENGCGGIWFDRLEMKKFDEAIEPNAEILLSLKSNPNVSVDFNQTRKCPKCADRIMMRHYSSLKREVHVDQCPECAGFFLDAGELSRIRSEYSTEAERKSAAEKVFDDAFKNVSKTDAKTAERIGKALRFLAPSSYFSKK